MATSKDGTKEHPTVLGENGAYFVKSVLYERTEKRKALAEQLERCERELSRARQVLAAEGRVTNSAGILQGEGAAVDHLCREVAALDRVWGLIVTFLPGSWIEFAETALGVESEVRQ